MPADPLVPALAGTLKQLPDIAKRVGVHYRADLLVADTECYFSNAASRERLWQTPILTSRWGS